jgi:hypothetical protein
VSIGAVETDAGIEVKLIAAEAPRLLRQPVEQRPPVATAPCLRQRREVVDVEVVSPGEAVGGTEPRHRNRFSLAFLEGTEEAVTLRPLHLVDRVHEAPLVSEVRSQCLHGAKDRAGIGRNNLTNHAAHPIRYSPELNSQIAIPSMIIPRAKTVKISSAIGTVQPNQVMPGLSAASACLLRSRWLKTMLRIGETA